MSPQRGSQVTRQVERSFKLVDLVCKSGRQAPSPPPIIDGRGEIRLVRTVTLGVGLSHSGHVSRKQHLKPQHNSSALTWSREFLLNYCNGSGVSLTSRAITPVVRLGAVYDMVRMCTVKNLKISTLSSQRLGTRQRTCLHAGLI